MYHWSIAGNIEESRPSRRKADTRAHPCNEACVQHGEERWRALIKLKQLSCIEFVSNKLVRTNSSPGLQNTLLN